jgi:hypothetical protein
MIPIQHHPLFGDGPSITLVRSNVATKISSFSTTEARTLKAPFMLLAIRTGAVALPVLVVVVVAIALPAKVAPAPLDPGCTVKVTGTWLSRLP